MLIDIEFKICFLSDECCINQDNLVKIYKHRVHCERETAMLFTDFYWRKYGGLTINENYLCC